MTDFPFLELQDEVDSDDVVIETFICDICRRNVPVETRETHIFHCECKKYGGRVTRLLKEGICLETLSKIAKRDITARNVIDVGVDDIVDDIPFREPPPIAQEIVEKMKASAERAGCRKESLKAKHFSQEVALCSVLEQKIKSQHPAIYEQGLKTGDISDQICLIDCGAAAGEFLHLFQSIMKTTIVLVEYYKPPRMIDDLYEEEIKNKTFGRHWKKVEEITPEDLAPYTRKINIVVAKHLCGDGMDEQMTCVVDRWRSFLCVNHMVLAPCCQQLCSWEVYCGSAYLQSLGLTAEDFEIIRTKTGWKSLLHRDAIYKRGYKKRHRRLYDVAKALETVWHHGRINYLENNGAENIKLFQFVSEEVTIKNCAITCDFPTEDPLGSTT